MVLIDTSVWIDHLRQSESGLVALLETARVCCHPFVIGELACGTLKDRRTVLDALDKLPKASVTTHTETMGFLDRHDLVGQGVGWVDLHLLASTAVDAGTRLWTRDNCLARLANRLDLLWQPPH